jgi:hypothetical protein
MTEYAQADIDAASSGPHSGWDTFDMQNEGVRMQAIQNLVTAPVFDAAKADAVVVDLSIFTKAYGYGLADSYLTDTDGMTDEEIDADPMKSIIRDAVFGGNWDQDIYFIEAFASAEIIRDGAVTAEARKWVADLRLIDVMEKAYRAGAEERRDQTPTYAAVPGI